MADGQKKLCDSKIKRALTNMLTGVKFAVRGLASTVVMTAVTTFITQLANSVVEVSDCHKKIITQVVSAMQGITMMYDAMSFLRVSGVGAVMMYSTLPLAIYPVIALGTLGLKQCNTGINARMSSAQYSVRSMSIGTMSVGGGFRSICQAKFDFKQKLKEIDDPRKKPVLNNNDLDNIVDTVFNDKKVLEDERKLVLESVEKYSKTDGIMKLLFHVKSNNNRLSALQALRYANKYDIKKVKFEYEKDGFDADVAIFNGEQFQQAIQLKTITGIGENALGNNIRKAKRQLVNVPKGTERLIEIDWKSGNSNGLNSTEVITTVKKYLADKKIDKITINVDGASKTWSKDDF